MIILDEPFVSDLLIETIVKEELPVIENSYLKEKQTNSGLNPIACEQAVIELNTKDFPLLYSNSENAIHWVFRHLKNTTLPGKIELFKNKVKFRMLVQDMFPDFYFKEIAVADLNSFDLSETAFPFIIKPSVGFFSLGVHKVDSIEHWPHIVAKINDEVLQNKKLYPTEVVNQENYIIEQLINGDEYAFDAYFDGAGNPVILGIFKHLFSSDSDVSDRVYYTSKNLIETQLEPFTNFLKEIGKRTELRNFPLHVEVRLEHNR